MTKLRVDLQDGFQEDTVILAVNGQEVFREPGVTTKTQLGVARYFETEVAPGPTTVTVSLPERGLLQTFELDVAGPTYLGVSLTPGGEFTHRVQSTTFRYA